MHGPALFEERQRFHHSRVGRVAIAAGTVAVAMTVPFLAHVGAFALPGALGVGVGALAMALLIVAELHVAVRADALYLRFFPILREQRFDWSDIARVEARRYRPIREYGGWGVRFGRTGRACNVYGNRGVELTFQDGRRLLIGSQRASELAASIRAAGGLRDDA